jgi:hypothetical protein
MVILNFLSPKTRIILCFAFLNQLKPFPSCSDLMENLTKDSK